MAKQKQDVSSGWALSSRRSLLTWKTSPRQESHSEDVFLNNGSAELRAQALASLASAHEWSLCGSHRPLTMEQFPQQRRGHRKHFGVKEGEEAWKNLHQDAFVVWNQCGEASIFDRSKIEIIFVYDSPDQHHFSQYSSVIWSMFAMLTNSSIKEIAT